MPGVIDLSALSPTQGFFIPGAGVGRSFTEAFDVSGAGDVNGDGFDDVVVGHPFGGPGPYRGGAYVVFGGADTGALGFIIQGEDRYSYAGTSVSSAGDVNGDGFDDVIVGTPFGKAFVVFGGAGGFGTTVDGQQVVDLSTLTGDEGFVIQGQGNYASGLDTLATGDINGDGFDDVVVGGPFLTDGGFYAGGAYVLFGGAGGFGTTVGGRQVVDLTTLSGDQGFFIQGEEAYDVAGWSVSAAGDVNGDGFDDVIVGTRQVGAAYVVFGGAGGFGTSVGGRQVVDLTTLTGDEGFVIQGSVGVGYSGGSGYSVSAAGDVNGDGFGDVVVGAPSGSAGGSGAGEAYVLFGGAGGFGATVGGRQVVDLTTLTGSQGFAIQGDAPGDAAGWSVSAAGDVNGDGFADVIVGAPFGDDYGTNAGKAYVLFGGAGGFGSTVGGRQVVDLSALTDTQGFIVQGAPAGDGAGYSVASSGDVNGDGFDDVIVGAVGRDRWGYVEGHGAYVVFGGNFTGAVDAVGGDGDDVINSGPTGQTIFGARGDDTLNGNDGSDSLNGGFGDDSLNGGADDDTLAGGSGDDTAVGGGGDDRTLGGDGNDNLSGRAGDDRLLGEAHADSLFGNAGNDYLDGGQGTDILRGGDGDDTLLGGGRGDVLTGGDGADVLTGGTGGDRFVFGGGTSLVGAPDTIIDFRGGFDIIVVRTGGESGSFIGTATFTGGGGIEARFDATLQQLQVDLNGDGTLNGADLAINGATLSALTADDLLFV